MSKPVDWRARYDTLLKLLFKIRNKPALGYADLRMRCPEAEELHKFLDSQRRYYWKTVGSALHLFPVHDPQGSSVAFVVKASPGKYQYTINAQGRKSVTSIEPTEIKAKQAVEKHFELLQAESE